MEARRHCPQRSLRVGASVTSAGRAPDTAARNSTGAPGLPMAWHRQTEDEIAAAHEYGFLCGLRAASAAMDRALAEPVEGMGGSAKQIVQRLIRVMDIEVARASHE